MPDPQLDTENDFGFQTANSASVVAPHLDKAQALFDAIDPFLRNLMQNPKDDILKWPNRVDAVTKFRAKLLGILNG